ncbi:MAG TPA: hypothetical protein VGO11_00590 [Chthoniobacteraceae bacterium]|jgi:hypothetical protein|nr:hypothetical protein [Chthoniobacteraceae bacterium]
MKPRSPIGYPATESIEEAITLLRRTPAATLLCAFVGGVPFWLALLYFVADMSRDAFAAERLAGASLTLAVLYLWKKCWQSVYAASLHNSLAGVEPPRWTLRRVFRLVVTQAQTQFFGLFVRPIAYQTIIPSAWISAYYQNVTVLGDGRDGHTTPVSSQAWAQARLWPGQNHCVIAILGFFLFFVWVNIAITCGTMPALMKSLLGIETMASRNTGAFVLSSTFFTSVTALSMLLVEPIWTAVYAVRCFHGTSLQSGADVRAGLRAIRARATALALLLMIACGSVAPAALQMAPTPAPQVDPERLDRSIEQTLERREFAWRSPRIDVPEAKKEGWLDSWLKAVGKWFRRQWEAAWRKIEAIRKWLKKFFFPRDVPEIREAGSGGFHIPRLDAILYVAGGLVAVLLLWAVWRYWRGPRRQTVVAEAVTPLPDLSQDDVFADELPEDGWLQLARDLVSRGELRLALRAAYLAGLAYLGDQQLISIARHKSNMDYRRELRRRARTRAEMLAAFDENLTVFERAWYGDHGVTLPMFEEFTQNLERIRAC